MNEDPPYYEIRPAAICGRAGTTAPVLPAGSMVRDHIS